MLARRIFIKSAIALLTLLTASPIAVQAAKPTPVVATFSILGDMVERIGGEHVAVTTLVGPDGDAHVYQPTTADARAMAEAQVLIENGLEFEGWLDRLVKASNFDGMRVVATNGIKPIPFEESEGHHDDEEHGHHHGTFDPHAWQSLRDAVGYVNNITTALAQNDPSNASTFYLNRAAYVSEIKALDEEIQSMVSTIPDNRRVVITSHDALQYFGRDYGLTFLAPQGLSTESEASAKEVAGLIKQIREEGIKAVFVENIADSRLIEQIANETGANIGGKLYSDALSGSDGPAATYLKMLRHNSATIVSALGD